MVCPFCGKPLHDDELFCADCEESLGIATAVADRTAVPPDVSDFLPPPRPEKKKRVLLFVLIGVCALSLSFLALLAGAFYDTADPLNLQDILWPGDGRNPAPSTPNGSLNAGDMPSGLTPAATPVSRGEPIGDDRDNACLLLEAAVLLDEGVSADAPEGDGALTDFLWLALRCAEPSGRFKETPDGYYVPLDDMADLYRETLGRAPSAPPAETPAFAAVDGGYEWRDDFTEDWRIDIFEWDPQSDGSVRVRFNVLYAGMLYDSFVRQGEALLTPNQGPFYYRFCLTALNWDAPGRFRPSQITASSSLRGQDAESYLPDKLVDGSPATAWIAGEGGEGAWLTLSFDGEREVTGLTIVNGVVKDAASMRQNSRVKELRVSCGDFQMDFELEDAPDYNTGGDWQSLVFGQAVKTDKITITILSLYTGSASDRACVSEIELF